MSRATQVHIWGIEGGAYEVAQKRLLQAVTARTMQLVFDADQMLPPQVAAG